MHDEKNKLYITQSDSELAQLLIISISLYLFAAIYMAAGCWCCKKKEAGLLFIGD